MAPRTVSFQGYAPIPVGHRVELTFFSMRKGIFDSTPVANADQPMVRDLDTEIAYQTVWHVTGEMSLEAGRVTYPLDPPESLPVHERLVARVLACRVVCAPQFDSTALLTTLVVEEEPAPRGPHR